MAPCQLLLRQSKDTDVSIGFSGTKVAGIRVLSSALEGGEVVVRSQIRMGSRVPGKRGNTRVQS